ncbi:MAG TPA: YceI family protein [Vicinamibacterales bacterium]|jgi:polyisoprenoid-binding protein YceI|nr:YceI family protein [Vicinamibacterales bacterium]
MKRGLLVGWSAVAVLAAGVSLAARPTAPADIALAIDTAKVTIAGTSNIHEYTASTTNVRVTQARLGAVLDGHFCDDALKPGAVEAFEISIGAATLTSPKGEALDKNMRKALKTDQFPEIRFRLARLETTGKPAGTAKAIGTLIIAGVEREVALDITTRADGGKLFVQGHLDLLMTDYGIKPPTAMMGMLKTDPKVTVTFETVLAVPLS